MGVPAADIPHLQPLQYKSSQFSPLNKTHQMPPKKEKLVDLDYANNYVHSGTLPVTYISNVENATQGYPRLQKLKDLKKDQILKHAITPCGARVRSQDIVSTLHTWIHEYNLQFDVVMIGALVDNQFIRPILEQLPLHRLCAKPGFLFVWATSRKIQELSKILAGEQWNKKFRRSEELVFVTIDKSSPYYPGNDSYSNPDCMFENQQWHCWMCITGTVRRSTDNHLIHCNVDTDLQLEPRKTTIAEYNAVPDTMYRVAENFSNANRRLHIIPSRTGYNTPVRLRRGWVIMSPDVMVNNFNPLQYEQELYSKSTVKFKNGSHSGPQVLVPQTKEIEDLRPKSPVPNGASN